MTDRTSEFLRALDDLFDFSDQSASSFSNDLPPAAVSGVDWTGTRAGEKLWGTNRADIIHGRGGDDDIRGWKGADRLYGDGGNDMIAGWEGKDLIYGGRGADNLDGGDGNDRIFGQKGNDELYGSYGDDLIKGQQGKDYIEGGDGNDRLLGGGGDDYIAAERGNSAAGDRDVIIGGRGNDELYGGSNTRFMFDDGWGHDTIKYFSGILDLKKVKGLHNRDQLNIKEVGGDVVIKFDGNSITLVNISGYNIPDIDILV